MINKAFSDIWQAMQQYSEQALFYGCIFSVAYAAFIILRNLLNVILRKECYPLRKVIGHILFVALFGIYLSYVISLTLSGREPGSRNGTVNLVLFSTLFRDGGLDISGVENVLLFIPLGIILPVVWKGFRRWWNMVLAAFVASTLIECVQFLTLRGYCELDDIILNIAGAWMGYFVFFLCYVSYCAIRHRLRKDDAPVNRISLIVIQLLMVLLMLVVIFGFSSEDGNDSGHLSLKVTEKIIECANEIGIVNVPADATHTVAQQYEGYVRKAAHLTEYALLALSFSIFLYCRKIKWFLTFILTQAFVLGIACLDEWNQLHQIGRNGNYTDILIDNIGSLILLLIMSVILRIGRIIEKRKLQKG